MAEAVETSAVAARFLVGVAAGGGATLVMDAAMAQLPEGDTPPAVASGVLTGTAPGEAPERLATVVHYLAGGLTGALFVWLHLVGVALLGDGAGTAVLAGGLLYALMVGFFAVVVLPRSMVPPERVGAIRRDWAVSAAVYLLVVVPVVAAVAALQ
ncbi:MAG: hypothetical protein ABEI39_04070 [Halobacteriales archaeon]